MTFSLKQLTHFATTLGIKVEPALLKSLFDLGLLQTPASFFQLIAPELKEAGIGGREALSFVSGRNKERKVTLDVLLTAVGVDAKTAAVVAAGAESLDDVRGLEVDELVEKGLTGAVAKRTVALLESLAIVLDDLDGELQVKPMKKV
jgi:hypothetical protein